MGALTSAAVLIEKGNIWVGSNSSDTVDLGAVRKVKFIGKLHENKVDSDNRGTILNKMRINGEIEFEWLECASVSNLEVMFKGAVAKSNTATGSTGYTGEATSSGSWSYDKFIPFTHQDKDATKPTGTSVTASTDGSLVLNTDYFIVQDPGSLKWGYVVRDSSTVTTQSQSLTAAYTVNPAASLILTGGTSLTLTDRYIKIVGTLDGGSTTRVIILSACTVTSDMMLPFVDVESANDVGVMPVKAENNKGASWTYTDTINTN